MLDIYYHHLRYEMVDSENNVHRIPYATLAMNYNETERKLYVAASLCSPNENFVYKTGRKEAKKRLLKLVHGVEVKQLSRVFEEVESFDDAKDIFYEIYIIQKWGHLRYPTYHLSTV